VDGGASWVKVPQVTPAEVKKAKAIYRRFTGDPGFESKPGKPSFKFILRIIILIYVAAKLDDDMDAVSVL